MTLACLFMAKTAPAEEYKLEGRILLIDKTGKLKPPSERTKLQISTTGKIAHVTVTQGFFKFKLPPNTQPENLDIALQGHKICLPYKPYTSLGTATMLTIEETITTSCAQLILENIISHTEWAHSVMALPRNWNSDTLISIWSEQNQMNAEATSDLIKNWIANASDIRSESEPAMALAAFAKNDYNAAGFYAEEIIHKNKASIENIHAKERMRSLRNTSLMLTLRALIETRKGNLALALEIYKDALKNAIDQQDQELLASIMNNIGSIYKELGQTQSNHRDHLIQAIVFYRRSIEVCKRSKLDKMQALVQNNLGSALMSISSSSLGKEANDFLKQAEANQRRALHTHGVSPRELANIQFGLGNILREQAFNIKGKLGIKHINQSINAYRQSTRFYTQNEHPQQWGLIQTNLGIAFRYYAELVDEKEKKAWLEQANTAQTRALSKLTVDESPREWATIQYELGITLAKHSGTPIKDLGLLERSIQMLKNSLDSFQRDQDPLHWAAIQYNIGLVYAMHHMAAPSGRPTYSITEAEEIIKNSLSIYTKQQTPKQWAMAKLNLGNILSMNPVLIGQNTRAKLAEAVESFQDSLQVITQTNEPQLWFYAQSGLCLALQTYAGWQSPKDSKRAQIFNEANNTCRLALAHLPENGAPKERALIYSRIASSLMLQIELKPVKNLEKTKLAQEAQRYLEQAIKLTSPESDGMTWAMAQMTLGKVLRTQAKLKGKSKKGINFLNQAEKAYNESLKVYTRHENPLQWGIVQFDIIATTEERAKWSSGEERLSLLRKTMTGYQRLLGLSNEQLPTLPTHTAAAKTNLGYVLMQLGLIHNNDQGFRYLQEAIRIIREALNSDKSDTIAEDQVARSALLGLALLHLAERTNDHNDAQKMIEEAAQLQKESLRLTNEHELSTQNKHNLEKDLELAYKKMLVQGVGASIQGPAIAISKDEAWEQEFKQIIVNMEAEQAYQSKNKRLLRGQILIINESNSKKIPPAEPISVCLKDHDSCSTTLRGSGRFAISLPNTLQTGNFVTILIDEHEGYEILYPTSGRFKIPHLSAQEIEIHIKPSDLEKINKKIMFNQIANGLNQARKLAMWASLKSEGLAVSEQGQEMERNVPRLYAWYNIPSEDIDVSIEQYLDYINIEHCVWRSQAIRAFIDGKHEEAQGYALKAAQEHKNQLLNAEQKGMTPHLVEKMHEKIAEDLELAASAHVEGLDFAKSIETSREALRHAVKTKNTHLKLQIISNIALLYGVWGDNPKQALTYLDWTKNIYTEESMPTEWATTQSYSGYILLAHAVQFFGDKKNKLQLLQEAEKAFISALKIHNKEYFPLMWASDKASLGMIYFLMAEQEQENNYNLSLLAKNAETASQESLEVFSRERLPEIWALINFIRANYFFTIGSRHGDAHNVAALTMSENILGQVFEVYTPDRTPFFWVMAYINYNMIIFEKWKQQGDGQVEQLQRTVDELYYARQSVEHKLNPFARTQMQVTLNISLIEVLQTLASVSEYEERQQCLEQLVEIYQELLSQSARMSESLRQEVHKIVCGNILTVKKQVIDQSAIDRLERLFDAKCRK